MNRKRTSPIWTMSHADFEKLVKSSSSIADILRYFSYTVSGTSHKMVKKRCEEEKIDYSHMPMGLNSNNGKRFQREKVPLKQVMIKNSTYHRGHLKTRLIKEGILKNKCSVCGQSPEWNGEILVMIIDHINGISNDHRLENHRLENLRLLCPNCNSQTKTFAGRNRKK